MIHASFMRGMMQLAALRIHVCDGWYLGRNSDDKFMQDGSPSAAADVNKQTCCLKLVFVLLYTIHKDTMRENGFIHHTFTYNQVPFYAYYCCSIHASPFGSTWSRRRMWYHATSSSVLLCTQCKSWWWYCIMSDKRLLHMIAKRQWQCVPHVLNKCQKWHFACNRFFFQSSSVRYITTFASIYPQRAIVFRCYCFCCCCEPCSVVLHNRFFRESLSLLYTLFACSEIRNVIEIAETKESNSQRICLCLLLFWSCVHVRVVCVWNEDNS